MAENYLIVNIDKIINNIKNIKNIDKKSKFCAVLKANAYGLGASVIAKHVEEYIDYIAVARLEEAINLRNDGIKKPILVLGYVEIKRINDCIKYNIDIPIYGLEYANLINKNVNGIVNAHLALDTGHGRIGFRDYEIDDILKLKYLKNLNVISAFSHFATADEEDGSFTKEQYEKFDYIIERIKNTFNFQFVHIANDPGVIHHKISKDMIRSGISMYGIYPSNYLRNLREIDLEQSFKFISSVAFIKNVKKNTSISYGRTFIADRDMKVATISIGYADGYFRSFSNVGEVEINGKKAKVLGTVCMDLLMVDVSNIDCNIGDEVVIYPDIYKEADKIGTIVYELMTSIKDRVHRVYIFDGKVINQ